MKEGTRADQGSGKGLDVKFDDNTEIPSNFESKLLSNITNKINLNDYLAKLFLDYYNGKLSVLVITSGDSVDSNCAEVLSEADITRSTSKEADPRIVRHSSHLYRYNMFIHHFQDYQT